MTKDNKVKLIVASVILFVVMLMSVYIVSVYGGNGNTGKDSEQVSFAAPELEKKEYEYNRRIDLVNAKADQSGIGAEGASEKESAIEIQEMEVNPFLAQTNKAAKKPNAESNPADNIGTYSKTSITNKAGHTSKQVGKEKNLSAQEPIEQRPVKRRKERYLDSSGNKGTATKIISLSIPCKIYGAHKVTNNSKIKARITEDVVIDNIKIKRNTIVTGIAQLTSTKVNIRFETIQYQNKTIPANMRAYSRDGLEGIYIEGGIQDDVKKDAYDEIIDATSTSTVDHIPVVGGIIKSATKKQNNKVYVSIPNDYTIYLKK
ncbi:Protein of unknown function [Saccharicrinis carchari]|uniref:Conjugative transposon TraM C-terminal domain-containing protein n=1 Tax=Saccharicrinis carchari TaxID=1168039 RepID=A0A521F083_SACCC|nr:conjugative transposon protein TraM [Saccharicrinis carchari]SMO89523.1 Protein of unknown function [Saccharicrinis carchari]